MTIIDSKSGVYKPARKAVLAYSCDGAAARHLPNSAKFCQPAISSPTASALAAAPTYLFTSVLVTPFPFSLA